MHRPIEDGENPYRAFENTSGKQIQLTLSANADGSEPRTTTVVPIGSESRLRRQSWIEDNRRRVDELSDGRLAYIYMPNTGGAGRAAFDRDFFSHETPDGEGFFDRLEGAGIDWATAAGENIAFSYGDGETVMAMWLSSPGHRANIENCAFTHQGVGRKETYWTLVLARRD